MIKFCSLRIFSGCLWAVVLTASICLVHQPTSWFSVGNLLVPLISAVYIVSDVTNSMAKGNGLPFLYQAASWVLLGEKNICVAPLKTFPYCRSQILNRLFFFSVLLVFMYVWRNICSNTSNQTASCNYTILFASVCTA